MPPTPRARGGGCAPLDFGPTPHCCRAASEQSRAPPAPPTHRPPPPGSGAVCCAPVCFFPRPICSLSRSGRAQPPVPFRKLFIAPCWGGCDSLPCPHPMAASPHIPHRGQRALGRPHCVPWVSAQCTEGQVGAVRMPAAPSPPLPKRCASVSPQLLSGERGPSTALSPTPLRPIELRCHSGTNPSPCPPLRCLPSPSPWSESTRGSLQRRSPRPAGRKAGRHRKYERLLAQAGLLRRGETTACE